MAGSPDTRQRILEIALALFAERGYAGTSVADITARLGISKAALYHHFAAKGDILDALLDQPLAGFTRLAATAAGRPAADLLADIVDTTAELHRVSGLLGDDPSVRRARADRDPPPIAELNAALTAALAGRRPTVAGAVRAHAAYAAAKNGTLAYVAATGRPPSPAARAELIAAALRTLS